MRRLPQLRLTPPARLRRCTSALLLLSLGLTGCYRIGMIPANGPTPGMRIVGTLSGPSSVRLTEVIGANATAVEGTVLERRGAEWDLSILRVDHRGAQSIRWNGERVVFLEGDFVEVQERSYDQRRTLLFVGAVAAAATVLALSFIRFVATGGDDDAGGTEPPL
jgi:hypothetical protein